MLHVRRLTLALIALAWLTPIDAAAQPLRSRVWIAVNAGLQAPSSALADRFEFERNVETATADIDYEKDSGIFFDGSVGIQLYKSIGAGVAFSRVSRDAPAGIDASIPHPFFDDQPRAVAGSVEGVTRAETAVHAQVAYTIPSRGPLAVTLSGGPSFLYVEQDVVTAVRYAESFPFDEATFTTADVRVSAESGIGFHAGIDVAWMTGRRRQFGLGGMLRYSRASIDLHLPDGRSMGVKAGGAQAGAGVRLRF